jgi:hypothetical protein
MITELNKRPGPCMGRQADTIYIDTRYYLSSYTERLKEMNYFIRIAPGYGLDGGGIAVRSPAWRVFIFTPSGPALGFHPTSYITGTAGCFPDSKAA